MVRNEKDKNKNICLVFMLEITAAERKLLKDVTGRRRIVAASVEIS